MTSSTASCSSSGAFNSLRTDDSHLQVNRLLLSQGPWEVRLAGIGEPWPATARLEAIASLRKLAGDPNWQDRVCPQYVARLEPFYRSVDEVSLDFELVTEIDLDWLCAAAVTASDVDWWWVMHLAGAVALQLQLQGTGRRVQAAQMLAVIEGVLRAAA